MLDRATAFILSSVAKAWKLLFCWPGGDKFSQPQDIKTALQLARDELNTYLPRYPSEQIVTIEALSNA